MKGEAEGTDSVCLEKRKVKGELIALFSFLFGCFIGGSGTEEVIAKSEPRSSARWTAK